MDIPSDDFAPLLTEIRACGQVRLPERAACLEISIAVFRAAARYSAPWTAPRPAAQLAVISARRQCGAPERPVTGTVSHVHEATQEPAVDGLGRVTERWVRADARRTLSVVVTQQTARPLPESIPDAVARPGSAVLLLGHGRGGLIECALPLRDAAEAADLVVPHINSDDVVPQLAFATPNRRGVALLGRAHHFIWLGAPPRMAA